MGSVLNIWHNYREAAEAAETDADNKLPTMEELEAAAQHCDINNVIIDADAKTVYLADPEMLLDVGSVGKGYAVEMVAQAAEARGLTSALISVCLLYTAIWQAWTSSSPAGICPRNIWSI